MVYTSSYGWEVYVFLLYGRNTLQSREWVIACFLSFGLHTIWIESVIVSNSIESIPHPSPAMPTTLPSKPVIGHSKLCDWCFTDHTLLLSLKLLQNVVIPASCWSIVAFHTSQGCDEVSLVLVYRLIPSIPPSYVERRAVYVFIKHRRCLKSWWSFQFPATILAKVQLREPRFAGICHSLLQTLFPENILVKRMTKLTKPRIAVYSHRYHHTTFGLVWNSVRLTMAFFMWEGLYSSNTHPV